MTKVEYQLTSRELILTGALRRLGRWRTIILMGAIFIGAILLIVLSDSFRALGWGFLAFGILYPVIMARAMQLSVNANPLLTARISMDFGDFGIISVADGYRSERSWRSLLGWTESAKYFFLHVDTLGTAIAIPKRAFTDEQLKLFSDQLRANLKHAR